MVGVPFSSLKQSSFELKTSPGSPLVSDPSGYELILKPWVLSSDVNFNSTGVPTFTRIGDGEYSYFLAVTSMTCALWSDGELCGGVAEPELRANALSKNKDVIRNALFTLSSLKSGMSRTAANRYANSLARTSSDIDQDHQHLFHGWGQ